MCAILPDLIDPWRAAARREQYAGTLELAQCTRLQPLLLTSAGTVTYRVCFAMDADGYAVISGTVAATLQLTCQRCLGALDWPVTADLQLALVHHFDEADTLPERYEPWVVTDRLMPPVQFLEDELLLALPIVPLHTTACLAALLGEPSPVVAAAAQQDAVISPFAAALASWPPAQQ